VCPRPYRSNTYFAGAGVAAFAGAGVAEAAAAAGLAAAVLPVVFLACLCFFTLVLGASVVAFASF